MRRRKKKRQLIKHIRIIYVFICIRTYNGFQYAKYCDIATQYPFDITVLAVCTQDTNYRILLMLSQLLIWLELHVYVRLTSEAIFINYVPRKRNLPIIAFNVGRDLSHNIYLIYFE